MFFRTVILVNIISIDVTISFIKLIYLFFVLSFYFFHSSIQIF